MNDLSQHYGQLLGLKSDWLVYSVDLDLEAQRVEIHLQHNPDELFRCLECGQKVVPGRPQHAADSLWARLSSDKQREHVEAVTVGMWAAFVNSVEEHVLQPEIVHDRFRIAKHLSEAVQQVRRAEHKAMRKEGDERLMGSRYLWLTSPEQLSEEKAATMEDLNEANLKTSRALALRELYRNFFEQGSEAQGRAFFQDGDAWASRYRLKPMVKVAKMIKRHLHRIVTWFAHRISNASSNGFNSLIRALKSAARGFRGFEDYRTRNLIFCGQLSLLPESGTHTTHEVP